MELKGIDNSRVIYFTQVRRSKGQLFLPNALKALISRYHFQKFPTQPDELLSDTLLFQQGLFEDVGINEFGLYPDGVVVGSRTDTDLLDRFLADILTWAAETLDLVEVNILPREHHYESSLIVSMKMPSDKSFPYLPNLNRSLTQFQETYGLRAFEFALSALQVAHDMTTHAGRKPIPFTIVRRVNVPFEANIYLATAPLKTNDHIAVLEALEKDLS